MSCGGFSDGFRESVEVFCRPLGWSGADLLVQNRFIGDLGRDFWVPNRFADGFRGLLPSRGLVWRGFGDRF